MNETVVLAPAGYEVDPDLGSDPERPWRLVQGLSARGMRVVVVARRFDRVADLGPNVILRLLPGRQPATVMGRLADRLRLYRYARAVAIQEVHRGGVIAVHHFAPCSPKSPSLLPVLPSPFVYGPMPGVPARATRDMRDRGLWLGIPDAGLVQNVAGSALEGVVSPIGRALWRRTIARADAVTVEAQVHKPVERPDAVVIPMALDTEVFSPDNSDPTPGRIVAVGGLWPRKGFDLLIQAMALAARELPTLHAVIAGQGSAMQDLTRLASKLGIAPRVSIVGRLSRQELPTLYRSAVIGCHPARLDNFPTAVVEAMSCGLPMLVSDVGALPEIIGNAGFIHRVGDVETLAQQLVEIMGNSVLRRELAAAARARALARHALDVMCSAYLDLYATLQASRVSYARAREQAKRSA